MGGWRDQKPSLLKRAKCDSKVNGVLRVFAKTWREKEKKQIRFKL